MLNTTAASPRTDGVVPEHQRRVDEIQAQVRDEEGCARASAFPPKPPRPDCSTDALDHRIAEEIESIRVDLDLLGGTLVCDPALLERHAKELQSIDRIHQLLGHLARIIAAEQKDLAVDQVTLTDLRARLQRRRPCTPA
ncbi:hypothetical protein [Sphingosinicella sp. CPCC 101087]|uniref:hypothetical protein n=1 Tax=Sphingosinicella sp. CPCC 101087 TaxID=2497754 RepID=UPI00101D9747|nr:hypothetical protein [Sphingosinicella sp. CPCC 101087]